jgi:oligoribonuclease NrnB/cAMP/cGMP phosphodiesterase (DHH superfamily)
LTAGPQFFIIFFVRSSDKSSLKRAYWEVNVRLLTRSDFDGSVCAAILEELGLIDEILYIHPKDLQDNKIEVTANDILANVPFVDGCGLWFDHHSSEQARMQLEGKFQGASENAPSAAQVIYDYYKKDESNTDKLKKFEDLIRIVGKADSAQFTKEDILHPQGWIMLAFIADPRTGLGYKRTFRISNFDLMKQLPQLLRNKSVEEILKLPDFQERLKVYREENEKYKQLITRSSTIEGNAIVIDLRDCEEIPVGNRFLEYVLYPEQNISIRIANGKNKEFAMISVGHSIINQTSHIDVGVLTLNYGGGGHEKVGTCQVPYEDVDRVANEMLEVINASK